MPKQTPLYAEHVAAGAKIVDFAGWDMPIHYGSQLEEHKRVRSDAGMFDVSHMLPVDISGAGAQAYLRHLLANDVAKLKTPGKALYTCMLNPSGGIVDDLIVYGFAPDDFRVVVNAGTADKDIAWMREVARQSPAGANVSITPRRDLAIIAVQGPHAQQKVWQALPETEPAGRTIRPFNAIRLDDLMLCFTGYTGESGYELICPTTRAVSIWQALCAAGVRPAGLGARDTLRLEAGMALYGQDMDDTISPLEAGLSWTVDMSEGHDFIGRPALENSHPEQTLAGLVLVDRGVLRSHMNVSTPHGKGQTTSGSFAPSMNASIALARIPIQVQPGDEVKVEVRDKHLKARVVTPPFVRQGKVLV